METSALTVLSIVAMGLMVLVTGGVVYLTAAEWRDRRRQGKPQKR